MRSQVFLIIPMILMKHLLVSVLKLHAERASLLMRSFFAYGEHTSIDGIHVTFTAHGASTFRGCGLSCYDASTGKFNPDNPGCSHCMTNTVKIIMWVLSVI